MKSAKKVLSPELLEKARLELNEIQSEVPGQIQALRQKILENPNLNFRTDDAFLLRFLRARKFNQKRTLELIVNYYKQRERYPEIFSKWPSSGLENVLSSNYHGVLVDRDSNGSAILNYNSIAVWDPNEVPVDDLITHTLLTVERLIEEEEIQINGVVLLVDMKGLNMKHLWHISPMVVKKAVTILLHSFPVRIKAIHYTNEPFLFDALFLVVKPFFGKKLLSRISFHGSSLDSLHQTFSPEILPEELGGHLGPFDNTEWNRALKSHEEIARKNLSFGLVGKTLHLEES